MTDHVDLYRAHINEVDILIRTLLKRRRELVRNVQHEKEHLKLPKRDEVQEDTVLFRYGDARKVGAAILEYCRH